MKINSNQKIAFRFVEFTSGKYQGRLRATANETAYYFAYYRFSGKRYAIDKCLKIISDHLDFYTSIPDQIPINCRELEEVEARNCKVRTN